MLNVGIALIADPLGGVSERDEERVQGKRRDERKFDYPISYSSLTTIIIGIVITRHDGFALTLFCNVRPVSGNFSSLKSICEQGSEVIGKKGKEMVMMMSRGGDERHET
jgi:hypothetical protein